MTVSRSAPDTQRETPCRSPSPARRLGRADSDRLERGALAVPSDLSKRSTGPRLGRERPSGGRWGTAGFGLIGPIIIGPSLSILGALVLGLDRRRFALMFTIGTVAGFGLMAFVADLVRGTPATP